MMLYKFTQYFFNKATIVFFGLGHSASIFALQSTDSDLETETMKQRSTVLAFGRQCQFMALTLAVLCLSFTVSAQQGYEKQFGGPKDDFGQAILQTKDHGYIEVGSTRGVQGDDNDFDIFVVRTDVDGTVGWTRTYDEGFVEQAEDVVPAEDGSYLIAGFRQATASSSEQTYLVKLDRYGEVLFSKSYGDEGISERGRQIVALPNQEYLITGFRRQPGTDQSDIIVTKVDKDGEELFRTIIDGNFDAEGFGAVIGADGGIIVGANARASVFDVQKIVLYGLNADGMVSWNKTYGDDDSGQQLENIIRTHDDHLVFVGVADGTNKALIAKANLNGDTLWYRKIDAGSFDDILYNVIEEDNGESLVAVGKTFPTAADLDVLLIKVRADDGQVMPQRNLGDEETLDVGIDLAQPLAGR